VLHQESHHRRSSPAPFVASNFLTGLAKVGHKASAAALPSTPESRFGVVKGTWLGRASESLCHLIVVHRVSLSMLFVRPASICGAQSGMESIRLLAPSDKALRRSEPTRPVRVNETKQLAPKFLCLLEKVEST